MAEHVWTVLCQKILTDPETQVVSLIDVFDHLILDQADDFDIQAAIEEVQSAGGRGVVFPTRMHLVTQWVRSDSSKPEISRFRLSLESPAGERLQEQEVLIELTESVAQRITIRFDKMSVTGLGRYWYIIETPKERKNKKVDWERVANLPLDVVVPPG
jgi:hypothetical protein